MTEWTDEDDAEYRRGVRRGARNKRMLFVNALGGPRLLLDNETMDVAKETSDGKQPNFQMMSAKAAARWEAKQPPPVTVPTKSIMVQKDNILGTKFLRLVHSATGKPVPYVDPWYAEVENRCREGTQTEADLTRLDAEGIEAQVEITLDTRAEAEAQRAAMLARLGTAFDKPYEKWPDLPGDTLEIASRDRDMIGRIIERIDDPNKVRAISPAQSRFLHDLQHRYANAGVPLPLDVREFFNGLAVEGQGEQHKWPTLADEMVHAASHQKHLITGQTIKRLNNTLIHCEKFVLDAAAVQRVAEAVRAYPEQLALNSQFARPPFETCWIELPVQVWGTALGLALSPEADDRIGYLFVKDRVYVCSQGPQSPSPTWSPLYYELNTVPSQDKLAREIKRIGGKAADLDMFYMGMRLLELAGADVAKALRAQHGFGVLSGPHPELTERLGIWPLAGELPIIVSILLMMNTPSQQVIKYIDQPKRWRSTHKGKKAIHQHRIVTLDLDRAPGVRLLSREKDDEREKRHVGWHQVRGHFVHDRRYSEVRESGRCDHGGQFGDLWCEFEPGRWECLECGSKRTWRTLPNGRGDRDKPVQHHYHLKG